MNEIFNSNCPELVSRIRAFKAQVQEFQQTIDEFPPPIQPTMERSLATLLTQLEAVLHPQAAPLFIATHASETHWSALRDCLPFGIFSCDVQGRCIYTNPRCEEILGHPLEESLGDRWMNYVHPDDRDRVIPAWIEDAASGRPRTDQFRMITSKGDIRWLHTRTAPMFSAEGNLIGHTGTIEDITSQKLAEDQIKSSLLEKEALLKEIHHRVKNNLQIISSLIYLQAQRIDDPKVRQIFEDSQSRISSMALVHDSLYRSQDFARVNLSEYVQTLTSSLFHTYRIQLNTVNLVVRVDSDVIVSLEKAIPCGLILNELMTNALKHGFMDGETGEVTVTLINQFPQVCLMVENDGKHLPESFELQKIRSMGLRLVNALVDQLNGKVTVETAQKTRFKVIFDCA